MSFRRRLKYFLIHALNYTNKSAEELILSGKITVNGISINSNCLIEPTDELKLENEIMRTKLQYKYFKFFKPKGYECTFNKKIPNNLIEFFEEDQNWTIAGRLDKASEGLLIITNNGKWANEICLPSNFKEKSYIVEVEKDISMKEVECLQNGIDIGIGITRKSEVLLLTSRQFQITLTEGKNQQIRRMVWKIGNYVTRLKRIRIDKYYLENLKPGEKIEFLMD